MATVSKIAQLKNFCEFLESNYGIVAGQLPKSFTGTKFIDISYDNAPTASIRDIESKAKQMFPAIGSLSISLRDNFSISLRVTDSKTQNAIDEENISNRMKEGPWC
jgi:hypothetical protein